MRGWEGGPQVGCVMYGRPANNFLSLNVKSRDCYLALVVVRHGLTGVPSSSIVWMELST